MSVGTLWNSIINFKSCVLSQIFIELCQPKFLQLRHLFCQVFTDHRIKIIFFPYGYFCGIQFFSFITPQFNWIKFSEILQFWSNFVHWIMVIFIHNGVGLLAERGDSWGKNVEFAKWATKKSCPVFISKYNTNSFLCSPPPHTLLTLSVSAIFVFCHILWFALNCNTEWLYLG